LGRVLPGPLESIVEVGRVERLRVGPGGGFDQAVVDVASHQLGENHPSLREGCRREPGDDGGDRQPDQLWRNRTQGEALRPRLEEGPEQGSRQQELGGDPDSRDHFQGQDESELPAT